MPTRMPTRMPTWIRQHLTALRMLLAFTVLFGIAYPLAITAVAQLPGLRASADGSLIKAGGGGFVGSRLIGQAFTDAKGNPLPRYFQSRPSAATANVPTGYDPTASSASNLGPESITDTFDDPATKNVDEGKQSLLTQVCSRSLAIGKLDGVDGRRPYCTPSGVGAVLAVFHRRPGYQGPVTRVVSVNEEGPTAPFISEYQGVRVECHRFGDDVAAAQQVLVRGNAPAVPAVPADAVTASGSGLDPDISPAYARLQVNRVAAARHLDRAAVLALVDRHVTARTLGFLGEPHVNVLELNLVVDRITGGG
jgi:K+-transporting ATPase ATPase C chain